LASTLWQAALMSVARGSKFLYTRWPKAHQTVVAVLILGHVDVLFHVAAVAADLLEHLHAGLVGAAGSGPHSALMPAEIDANKLARLDPTIRTVDVLHSARDRHARSAAG